MLGFLNLSSNDNLNIEVGTQLWSLSELTPEPKLARDPQVLLIKRVAFCSSLCLEKRHGITVVLKGTVSLQLAPKKQGFEGCLNQFLFLCFQGERKDGTPTFSRKDNSETLDTWELEGIEAMIIALDGARDRIELSMQWSGREKPTLYLLGHVFLVVLTDWSCHIFRCHR